MPGPIKSVEELREAIKKFLEQKTDDELLDGVGLIEDEDKWTLGVACYDGPDVFITIEEA